MSPSKRNRRSRFQIWRWMFPIGLCCALVVESFIMYVAYQGWGHLPQIFAYDSAYSKLSVGMPLERVEELMGRPDEVCNYADGTQRYIYRAYPPIAQDNVGHRSRLSTRWTVDMDLRGCVTSLRREDNPC